MNKKPNKNQNETSKETVTLPSGNKTAAVVEQLSASTINSHLEEVLDVVKELDRTCDYRKCKTKTSLIGTDCNLCKFRYCMKHTLPEVHGCGELIKKEERTKFLHPVPQKVINEQKDLAKSREKLRNKLQDMNLSRKAKPAAGSSNKSKPPKQ